LLGGLDGKRHSSSSGFFVYGRVLGSLLAGNWQADYRQTNQFGGGVIATHYEDFRVTPVVDSELGVGWQNCTGQLQNLDDSLNFSGLALRGELRF